MSAPYPMSAQHWTPAVRSGLVPLHPLTFGALLGRPFAALRHNPKVLFGFAIVLQLLVALVTLLVVGGVAIASFLRLESLSPSSPDFAPVMWGTIAINVLVGLAMGLLSLAFTAVMQGVVAADIGYAALGEKAGLRRLWERMRPAFWRLLGWSLLQSVAAVVLIAAVGGLIFLGVMTGIDGSAAGAGIAIMFGVLLILAAIPLWVWLSTKLLLVPSILVLEGARLRPALVRSWRLTRGRFWNTFGVMFLIGAIMSTAVGVVSMPLSLLGSLFAPVIAPTGPNDASEVVTMLIVTVAPQLLVYVLQAVAVVVQCAAAAFIYLDCRMRYEGLDHTLIAYRERLDLGIAADEQGDPFAVDPSTAVSSAPPPRPTPTYASAPVGWGPYPPDPAAQSAFPAAPYQPQPQQQAYPGSPPQQRPGTSAPGPQGPPPPPPGYGGA
ncbi:MFS family permease [Microbacterium ginsengiterrae]|uniref:MFS family permease n=1 Tax=Microbacterium ginsengiterrae TaxID=546115 RepID=A0A7W9CDS0_9MICO|nr:glycerophosphoryl diester phosphodiesterase membrane domain-containing protein [Microbacterium ginsengiterrae]MBB5743765.1 MFS family permease [Microbacterium ginsengiterrae]